jgi:hypothetical protein
MLWNKEIQENICIKLDVNVRIPHLHITSSSPSLQVAYSSLL